MAELKPCPFCGGEDTGVLTTSYDGYWYAVFCENCMAHTRKCRKEEEAIEAWNKRTERPKGRWFDTGVENETGNIYFCSVCNKYNNPNKKDVEMKRAKEKPDFCPNCGADMRGESE